MKNLIGLTKEELLEEILSLGESKFRANQIWSWIYYYGVKSFDDMTNLSKKFRETLKENYSIARPKIVTDLISKDGTRKWLLEFEDNERVEMVYIPEEDRGTLCISSQIGCAMGCKFCHTGTMGLIRNLTASEIIEQFVHLRKLGNITHIVYMGMGEPLANLAPVLESIRFFHSEDAFFISLRRITISTCGIVSGINKITEQNLNVKLAVSLVSAENPLRSKIMPINDTFNLQQLKKSLLHYQNKGGSRFTLEYCMLSGVNCNLNAAKKLASFTNGLDAVVNLIPWNPAAELPWTTPSTEEINTFTKYLDEFHINYARRYTRGRSVNGACGQLATKNNKKEN